MAFDYSILYNNIMLDIFRNNTKLIIWLIVGSFCLWGVGSGVMSGTSGGNAAGKVFNKKVSNQEFNRYLKIVQIFGGSDIEEFTQTQLESQAWKQIALAMKADQLGFKVSNEEVGTQIMSKMSEQGAFDQNFYERWVKNVFKENPRSFEEMMRQMIATEKMMAANVSTTTISDLELQERYKKAYPNSNDEDYDKVKSGYRMATEEILQLESRGNFINEILEEAQIESFIEKERIAEEEMESKMKLQTPGSRLSTYVPKPDTLSKEETSEPK